MTDTRVVSGLAGLTLTIYWSCILLGLAIPAFAAITVDMLKHGQSVGQAVHQWRMHLFAPGYNLFIIAVLNAVPFVLLAVFALLHLGLAPPDAVARTRRGVAVSVAALIAIGSSLWTHVTTLWYPDAQGALAYVFLPVVLAFIIPVAYLAAWSGTWLFQRIKRDNHGTPA